MADERTAVLVVGAGLAGSAVAAFLATRRVDVLLVERHQSTSVQPRVTGQSGRTRELFGYAGVTDEALAGGTAGLHVVEPALLGHAERAGARVRFATEVVDMAEDAGGVTARVLNRWNERLTTVRAGYVVAADGNLSRIREGLGILRRGARGLRNSVSVVFDADALGPGPHVTSFEYHPDRGESMLDFTTDVVTDLVRRAVENPELEPRVQSVQAWETSAVVADTYWSGRVLLLGEAARSVPPDGTLAADLTVADAYDLAWRLAAASSGVGGPGLLAGYDTERRAVAERLARGDDVSEVDPGGPGGRAPDVPLVRAGTEISTRDLFGDGWTLLTAEAGGGWHEAATHATQPLRLRLTTHGLGPDLADPTGTCATAFGIGDSGASLVRPDGIVAWRADREPDDPAGTLRRVLRELLGHADTARSVA